VSKEIWYKGKRDLVIGGVKETWYRSKRDLLLTLAYLFVAIRRERYPSEPKAAADAGEHALRQVHGVGNTEHHQLCVCARGPVKQVV
jgi:hypothetical protein